ncbi:MAG: response regulator [Hyphomicrobiaceae bacterium]|nr:response regulator [Hyphomicrobiaceae bacterium]
MSLASLITPHLPYLRRFARTLTGSQESGDAYVAAALEALVADPSSFPTGMEPRAALYKVFLKLWSSLDINRKAPSAAGGAFAAIDRKLEALTPLPRQAFLLVAVEEFEPADAAAILDVDAAGLDKLIEAAGREIAQQVATDVLIIEDEPLIAMDIEDIVRGLGHTPVGNARTHSEASKLAKEHSPGLILADIQLADGSSGIDAVNELLRTYDVPVIFITAYPERLLTGDRPEPTFLLTKPFQPAMLKALISQALFFEQTAGLRKAG